MQNADKTVAVIAGESKLDLPGPQPDQQLLQLPISRAIFRLAWPAMTSYFFMMMFNIVDGWWVAKLGADALAGVGAASFIYWAIEAAATLVSTGVNAMVARFVGARDPEQASQVATQGCILAIFMALIVAVGGFIFQDVTYRLMGLTGPVFTAAHAYMTVVLSGLPTIFLVFALDACFRGMGDTKTPLKIISLALVLNAVLDPVFIFGWGPLPRLEVAGAALATVLSQALAIVFFYFQLKKRPIHPHFDRQLKSVLRIAMMWRISRIGAPIAFAGVIFSLTYMVLTRIVSVFGTAPIAAMSLGHRLEGLAYFSSLGFSVAAATLVGQYLGAGQPEKAERSAWLTIAYISTFLGGVCVLYLFFAREVFEFFISDPRVVSEGASYLRIIAIFEIFLGCEVVFEGAFGGAGDSLPPMMVSVPLTVLRIPLALVLANDLGLGSTGVWWAISSTTAAKGVIIAIWFKLGRWKRKSI